MSKKLNSIQTAIKFIEAVRSGEGWAELCQQTWLKETSDNFKRAHMVNAEPYILKGKVVLVEQINSGENAVVLKLKIGEKIVGVKVVREIAPFKPSKNGTWGVNPKSIAVLSSSVK